MRHFVALVFVTLLLVQPFSHTFIFVKFKANQNEIAKNLCEKKDVKGNTCHGCCQLKKQLKKADDQPQNNVPKTSTIKVEIIYCNQFSAIEIKNQIPSDHNKDFRINDPVFVASGIITGVFHPPKFA